LFVPSSVPAFQSKPDGSEKPGANEEIQSLNPSQSARTCSVQQDWRYLWKPASAFQIKLVFPNTLSNACKPGSIPAYQFHLSNLPRTLALKFIKKVGKSRLKQV
jgi:hypothetical protein